MSSIKCPVCGMITDDHAAQCNHCHTPIGGNVRTCSHCGNVYLKNLSACPECGTPKQVQQEDMPTLPDPPRKQNKTLWIALAVAVMLIALVGGYYLYQNSRQSRAEQEAYELAMKSTSVAELQHYLDVYADADQAHKEKVEQRLGELRLLEADWNEALVNNSRMAYEEFMKKHPNAPQQNVVKHKIDSLDWETARRANTIDAYQYYMDEHADGEYYDEAQNEITNIKVNVVQEEEADYVKECVRGFFSAFNAQSRSAMEESVSDVMVSFLGKKNATKGDVTDFMKEQWSKFGLTSLAWYVKDDFSIKKKEVGRDKYEYTATFTAILSRKYALESENTSDTYHVTVKVNPDGQIAYMEMQR